MNRLAAWPLAAALALAGGSPARAGQYETFDYYVQQMIAASAAQDATGVQTFREQLDNLRRPEAGDAAEARPLLQQGLEALKRDQPKEALTALRQAFIADPTDPEIADPLGLSYLRLRRLKEAERLLVYALALAPSRSASWLHLGQTYGQGGDASRAAGAFANAQRFAQDPRVVAELRQLATGDPVEAVRAGAQRALQPTPGAAAVDSGRPTAPSPPEIRPTVSPTASPAPTAPPAAPPAAPSASEPGPANAAPGASPRTAAANGLLVDSLRRGLAYLDAKSKAGPSSGVSVSPKPLETNDDPGQRIYRSSSSRACLIVTFRDGKTANLGTGLLVSTDGLVITNNHVIESADNLAVKCGDRESVAQVGKRSKEPDLALLTTTLQGVDGFVLDGAYRQDLIGQEVFVIGNPYGLEGTLSTGVVSGLREIDGVRYIQISAPISPGNSGGPVILRDGTVIGITTMALKKGQNINFAIATVELIQSALFDPARMKIKPSQAGSK